MFEVFFLCNPIFDEVFIAAFVSKVVMILGTSKTSKVDGNHPYCILIEILAGYLDRLDTCEL